MIRAARAAALTGGALALVFALTGCIGGAPAATPAADAGAPTSTPTATAEPTDPLTTVVALVARPEAVELRDADGVVVGALDHVSDPADAVAALTTVFGTAPSRRSTRA